MRKPKVRFRVLPCTRRATIQLQRAFERLMLIGLGDTRDHVRRGARVAPACVRDKPGFEYLISSFWSVCTTDTPRLSGTLSEPFAPLIVTVSGDTVAVTPCGKSTGAWHPWTC